MLAGLCVRAALAEIGARESSHLLGQVSHCLCLCLPSSQQVAGPETREGLRTKGYAFKSRWHMATAGPPPGLTQQDREAKLFSLGWYLAGGCSLDKGGGKLAYSMGLSGFGCGSVSAELMVSGEGQGS